MTEQDQDTKTEDDAIEIAESSEDTMGSEESQKKRREGKLGYEAELSTDEALNYLVSLIRGIKGGQVTLRQGDETLELEPSGTMALKVKASAKGRKEKLSFELAWRLPSEDDLEIE